MIDHITTEVVGMPSITTEYAKNTSSAWITQVTARFHQ